MRRTRSRRCELSNSPGSVEAAARLALQHKPRSEVLQKSSHLCFSKGHSLKNVPLIVTCFLVNSFAAAGEMPQKAEHHHLSRRRPRLRRYRGERLPGHPHAAYRQHRDARRAVHRRLRDAPCLLAVAGRADERHLSASVWLRAQLGAGTLCVARLRHAWRRAVVGREAQGGRLRDRHGRQVAHRLQGRAPSARTRVRLSLWLPERAHSYDPETRASTIPSSATACRSRMRRTT